MLESESPDGVGELDVDGEVVRVELELVFVTEASGGIDVHIQIRDTAIESETPVLVSIGMGLKIDHCVGGHRGSLGSTRSQTPRLIALTRVLFLDDE